MFKHLLFFAFFVAVFCQSEKEEYDQDQDPINNKPGVPVVVQQQSSSSSSSYFPCPHGWRYLTEYGKCIAATPRSLSWYEAEAYCIKLGANLMSLHSKTELRLAFDFVSTQFWVGLYKYLNMNEATWKFTNNETFHYVPYADGDGGNDCGYGHQDMIIANDQNCKTNRHPGICQKYVA